jgi:hypothetical protein
MVALDVNYGIVTYRQAQITPDGSDMNIEPDIAPLTGVAKIKASPKKLLFTGEGVTPLTAFPKPAFGHFDKDGDLASYVKVGDDGVEQKGIWLIANDDPKMNPQEWTYVAEVTLYNPDGSLHSFEVFTFELGSGETVDLTDITPLATSEGTPIVRGPRGYSMAIKGSVPTEADLPEFEEEGAIFLTEDTNFIYSRIATGWLEIPFLRGSDGKDGESIVGEQGPEGPPGTAGKDGAGLDFKGSVLTSSDLAALTTTSEDGDVYLATDTGTIHYFEADTSIWHPGATISGPEGPRGIQGIQGEKGDPGGLTEVSIGTVITAPPGTPSAASLTGTPTAKALNLTLTKGDKGDKGDPGASAVIKDSGWWKYSAPYQGLRSWKGICRRIGNEVFWQVKVESAALSGTHVLASLDTCYIKPVVNQPINVCVMGVLNNAAVTDPTIKYRMTSVTATTSNSSPRFSLGWKNTNPADSVSGNGYRYLTEWVAFSYITDDPFPEDNAIMGDLTGLFTPGSNP